MTSIASEAPSAEENEDVNSVQESSQSMLDGLLKKLTDTHSREASPDISMKESRSGSSKRKPKVTKKYVENEEDLYEHFASLGSIESESMGVDTDNAAGDVEEVEERIKIDIDEHGNYVLPEGTMVVQPEPVEEEQLEFKGPEFRPSKRTKGKVDLDVMHCTSCNKQISASVAGSAKRHPVLKVLICKKCYAWYTSAEIEQDEDGMDEQCRWCGEGGNLICCDYCHNAFCKGCIKRNLGRTELSNILDAEDDAKWRCYVCDPKPLAGLITDCDQTLKKINEYHNDKKDKERREKEKSQKNRKDKVVTHEQKHSTPTGGIGSRQVAVKSTGKGPVKQHGHMDLTAMKNRYQQKPMASPQTKMDQMQHRDFHLNEFNVTLVLDRLLSTQNSMSMLLKSLKEELSKANLSPAQTGQKIRLEVARKLKRAMLAFKKSFWDIEDFARNVRGPTHLQRQNMKPLKSKDDKFQLVTLKNGKMTLVPKPVHNKPKKIEEVVILDSSDEDDKEKVKVNQSAKEDSKGKGDKRNRSISDSDSTERDQKDTDKQKTKIQKKDTGESDNEIIIDDKKEKSDHVITNGHDKEVEVNGNVKDKSNHNGETKSADEAEGNTSMNLMIEDVQSLAEDSKSAAEDSKSLNDNDSQDDASVAKENTEESDCNDIANDMDDVSQDSLLSSTPKKLTSQIKRQSSFPDLDSDDCSMSVDGTNDVCSDGVNGGTESDSEVKIPSTKRQSLRRSRADIEAQRQLHKELLDEESSDSQNSGSEASEDPVLEESSSDAAEAESDIGSVYDPNEQEPKPAQTTPRRGGRRKTKKMSQRERYLEKLKEKMKGKGKNVKGNMAVKKSESDSESEEEKKVSKRKQKVKKETSDEENNGKSSRKVKTETSNISDQTNDSSDEDSVKKSTSKKGKKSPKSKQKVPKDSTDSDSDSDILNERIRRDKKKNNGSSKEADITSDFDEEVIKKDKKIKKKLSKTKKESDEDQSESETKSEKKKSSSKSKKKSEGEKYESNSSNYDSELEKEIDSLAKMPKPKTNDKKSQSKEEEKEKEAASEESDQEELGKTVRRKVKITPKKSRRDLINELMSDESEENAEDDPEESKDMETENKDSDEEESLNKTTDTLDNKNESTDEDEKARNALLADDSSSGDSSDDEAEEDEDESNSDVDKKKSNSKSKKVESDSDNSEGSVPIKKKKQKTSKLLAAKLSDSEDDFEDSKKKKKKRKTEKSIESSDLEVISDDSFIAPKKKKGKKKKSSSSSDSDSDVEKKRSYKQKGKKRRRIKMCSASSNSEEAEGDPKSGEDENNPGSAVKRKKIRKIMKDKKVASETKAAAKEEEERRKRIEERQKLFNQVVETDINEVPVTTKLVLESDKDGNPIVEVLKKIIKRLKPHQVEAVKFLWNCCVESLDRIDKGSGCILAHCMGLGKTLTVISFVHTMLTHKKTKLRTCLVVCPLNTVLNWQSEWEKWFDEDDQLDVYELSSVKDNWNRADTLQMWHEGGGVLIIGYEMYRNLTLHKFVKNKKQKKIFSSTLVDPGPDLVVCDEGHILKNDGSSLSKAMNEVKTRKRIVLTGTPLQNNLIEYHCMVNFVKPNLLGTRKEFANRFVNPITNGQCADSTSHDVKLMKRRAHILHESLAGCVQRKDYSALAEFLPPKHEYVLLIQLSEVQIELYKRYLEITQEGMSLLGGSKGARLFKDYQYLMRIWTHPWVLKLSEIREINKKPFSDEDSFLDDDSYDSDCNASTPSSKSDDSDEEVKVLSGSDADLGPRRTRGQTRAQRTLNRNNRKESASDKDEIVKSWKSRSRGGDGGKLEIVSTKGVRNVRRIKGRNLN